MLGYWLTPADEGSKFRSLTRAISSINRNLMGYSDFLAGPRYQRINFT